MRNDGRQIGNGPARIRRRARQEEENEMRNPLSRNSTRGPVVYIGHAFLRFFFSAISIFSNVTHLKVCRVLDLRVSRQKMAEIVMYGSNLCRLL